MCTSLEKAGYLFESRSDGGVDVRPSHAPTLLIGSFQMPPRCKSLADFEALWWTFYNFGKLRID